MIVQSLIQTPIIRLEAIESRLKAAAYLNRGVTFHLDAWDDASNEQVNRVFYSRDGLPDYVRDLAISTNTPAFQARHWHRQREGRRTGRGSFAADQRAIKSPCTVLQMLCVLVMEAYTKRALKPP